ncbi:MAG TPA: thioredoxin domain-containing protein [Patescibacteria group bacterium]|nr:thioredoxin domain-containing protein [Patescibacteria group bacterium]
MKKRILQASLVFCAMIVSLSLWARQEAAQQTSESPDQIEHHVETFLREVYAWGSAFEIKVNPPVPTPIAGLYEVPVAITYHGQSDHAMLYVSHDGRYIIRGVINSLLVNPYAAILQKLDIANHPHVGPAKACVNVVEFSDFECPHCRDAQQGIEKAEPQFPQVRFTFMDFPITQIHPWAMTAALAGRCAYQENPADYSKLRNLIFEDQDKIGAADALNKLVGLATQAGLNAATMQACISAPQTENLVKADMALGNELKVTSTPTLFVNGRPLVGWNAQMLEQYISYEQEQCQAGH